MSQAIIAAKAKFVEEFAEELKSAKNAELNDIFILEKYKVSAEGSKQAWDGQMTAVITSSETLGGNLVYLLWSPTPENLSEITI